MGEKEYLFYFTVERFDRFRYYHFLDKGHIVRFIIQYEALNEMYNQETIAEKNLTLSFEFERYLLEHPEWLDTIPESAEVVFLPKDDLELYKINLESAQHHSDGPVIFVEIESLRPSHSRLINPRLTRQPALL